MGSASDGVQILSEDARSKSTSGSGLPLTAGRQYHAHVQNKDHAISGDDSAVKVRKQYTITKQRERWTDEEHNKFLDALKLYGRAWRHIEEHVGTKTAVQIRSHAQKFFSKVVRVSSINAEENPVNPIEIPPPRPKRKPIHPYPRKMIGLDKTRAHLSNELDLTASPSSPILPQETRCLASVLSTLGSEATGVSNSNMSNSILSQTSSEAQAHDQLSALLRSETILLPAEKGSENGSNSPIPEDGPFVKEGSNEEISTQTLKLFGKTITIGEQSLSSSRNTPNISPGIRFLPTNTDYMWTAVSHGTPTVYCTQVPDENSNNVDHVSTTPIPCWQRQLYGRVPYPYQYNYLNGNTFQDKVLQKHGSLNGSNSVSINAEMDGV